MDYILLYFTLLYFTLLYSTLLYFTLGIAGDYAGIFPGDPSSNLGGLLDCHLIGLIILHMLSSKCMFVFFFEFDL